MKFASCISIITLFCTMPVIGAEYTESDLGRLFTSPEERNSIDKTRGAMSPDPQVQQRRSPSSVTVNGIVKRSDGKSTVWVNGKSNLDMRTIDGVKVAPVQRRPGSVAVYVDGELVRIKPGDTWAQKESDDRDEF